MFLWRRVWTLLPSGMWRRVVCYKCTSVSEEPSASTSIYTNEGGRCFFCNVRKLIPGCTASYTRRKQSSLLRSGCQTGVLGRNLTQECSKLLSAQRHSHVKIIYKLGNRVLCLNLFTVCYLQLCCGKYQELCNYRSRSQIKHRLPEAVPEFSQSTMQTLLPGSLINFQYSSDHSGKVKCNSSTFRI